MYSSEKKRKADRFFPCSYPMTWPERKKGGKQTCFASTYCTYKQWLEFVRFDVCVLILCVCLCVCFFFTLYLGIDFKRGCDCLLHKSKIKKYKSRNTKHGMRGSQNTAKTAKKKIR